MTTSVFSGAFALFLLFWLCSQTGNMHAALMTVLAAICGWFVNLLQDIENPGWAVGMGVASVVSGAIALGSVVVKLT